MKELSIEEKAKAYDDVVNKLKGFMAQGVDPLITRADVQDFFPELKESEDERTWIINYLSNTILNSSIIAEKENLKKAIAWLEKQGEQNLIMAKSPQLGEQKPAEWDNEDEDKMQIIINIIKDSDPDWEELINWLKNLKDRAQPLQKQEWSEEDENIRLRLIDYLYGKSRLTKDREDGISWLKSLKERHTWKPSEEQMDALEKECIAHSNYELCRLLEQLKKLRKD